MKPIAVFYHCTFFCGSPPHFKTGALRLVSNQLNALKTSQLSQRAKFMMVGVNGGAESVKYLKRCGVPVNAVIKQHGLASQSENLTIVEIEKWVKNHPGWYVLYYHSKGVSKDARDRTVIDWRACMMNQLVHQWGQCVTALDQGCEAVGCHWVRGLDDTQHYFAGNFWWAQSDFLRTLPSIYERPRIKRSGIASAESRYEAEVWIGNGPRLPRIKDFHPGLHHVWTAMLT